MSNFVTKSKSKRLVLKCKSILSTFLSNLGNIYYYKEDYVGALRYGKEGLMLAKELGYLQGIKDGAQPLYKSYKKIGKTELAFQMYEKFIAARDSIESEVNQKEVMRQEYKYTYEKQSLAD